MTEYEELHTEIMYLAHRQKETEDRMDALVEWADAVNKNISEWSEFVNLTLMQQGVKLLEKQRGEGYFRKTSSENWKEVYDKLEVLSLKIKGSGKNKDNIYIYNTIKEEDTLEKAIPEE